MFKSISLIWAVGGLPHNCKMATAFYCHIPVYVRRRWKREGKQELTSEYNSLTRTRSEKSGKLEVGGASRHSTGFGALEEGLISS